MYEGQVCVSFRYHIYGKDMHTLTVYSEQSGLDMSSDIPTVPSEVEVLSFYVNNNLS